ncbi:hypothetical protein HDU93_006190, partial [Gonapodya sp. JEL0774]
MVVITKGGQKVPQYPNRILSELDLQVPFLAMEEGANGALEERLFRSKVLLDHLEGQAKSDEREIMKRRIDADKLTLQLIQAACKAEKVHRALDLSALLNLPQSLEGAGKLAVHHHLPGLAERINLMKEAKSLKLRAQMLERETITAAAAATANSHKRELMENATILDETGPSEH